MSNAVAELAIRMAVDVAGVASEFANVGDAASKMGDDVDAAARHADDASGRLGNVAEAADKTASSSAQAAGGLGDLGGALSMMPGPLGAVGSGMEALAAPIMGVTGAADLLNLATESTVIQSARAKAAAIAQAITSKASAAATNAWAAAQRVLNLAMEANPIGLVIAAVALLVAGFILAYKKSEAFRNIVDKVMAAAKTAIGWVIDKVQALVDKVKGPLSSIWSGVKSAVDKVMGFARNAIGWVIDKVQALVDKVKGPLSSIWSGVKSAVGTAIGAVKDIIQGAINLVEKIIGKIGDAIQKAKDLAASVGIGGGHNVSDPPVNPGPVPGGGGGSGGAGSSRVIYSPQINLPGVIADRTATSRELRQLLLEDQQRFGALVLGTGTA